MLHWQLIFLLLFFCSLANGQKGPGSVGKIETLKQLLTTADTLKPGDTVEIVNDKISLLLSEILTSSETSNYDLERLLSHPFLNQLHSKDKRLWIFSWYANTGGSWRRYLNLIHYRTKSNIPKISEVVDGDIDKGSDMNVFCSDGAAFDKIYKLKAKNKELYLCIGSVISCNTCIDKVATVVDLTKDTINFKYPAFPFEKRSDGYPEKDIHSCFTLEARNDNIEKFEFNPNTQTLSLIYLTDDLTPVRSVKQRRIVRKLIFDGQKFVGKWY